ncbi:site-specific integrase [Cupriavidus plantarum]|uniref:site-specific integrase n=1 Tax=Cupriavidus plantarum TaxID=942865 RepID=UPI000E24175A|nr:site-specific integrase [Cupriavidus plantarum]REE86349.1 phage integrase family protein [Cupriavidus plantarum]
MPNFRKRGELQWQARVRRKGYPDQVKTFNTRAGAEEWAQDMEHQIDRRAFVSRAEAESTSLYEALGRYEREVTVHKNGEKPEKSVLRAWKSTELALRSMPAIRSTDIATLRNEWLKTLKPATVLRRLQVLSGVFNIAPKEWGMESLSNPLELVRKPQANNARTRRIAIVEPASIAANDESLPSRGIEQDANRETPDDELKRVIAATGSDILPAIIQLAVESAMRRGEIVSLRWQHINLRDRVAHLPKTNNGESRDVPLSSKVVEALEALVPRDDLHEDEKANDEDGRVFKIRSDAVTRAFERAVQRARTIYEVECKKAGMRPDPNYLADLRFHDLRHEATSRLAAIFPMDELTKITGHKDPRMLMRYYHPRAKDLAKRLP